MKEIFVSTWKHFICVYCSEIIIQIVSSNARRQTSKFIRFVKPFTRSPSNEVPPRVEKLTSRDLRYRFTLYQKICTIQGQLNSPLSSLCRGYTSPLFKYPDTSTCSWRERAWARAIINESAWSATRSSSDLFSHWLNKLTDDALEINIFRGCSCVFPAAQGIAEFRHGVGGDKLSRGRCRLLLVSFLPSFSLSLLFFLFVLFVLVPSLFSFLLPPPPVGRMAAW